MAIDVLPVAQAVMVVRHGPVAPESIESFPAIMFTQELGFMYGRGSAPVATRARSASTTASRPPMAVAKVTATRGASSGVTSRPACARARWTTSML